MHESAFTYLGMEWGGRLWVWSHLPFGLAPACRLYTLMKQEVYRPLREQGVKMAFLIDDQAGVAAGKGRAQYQCRTVSMVLAALGFTLSLSKCQLTPKPTVRFLGFIVDAAAQAFRVPEDKVTKFIRRVEELSKKETITKREAAQIAGKIISMAPAIGTAPIHSRQVGRAMVGVENWDDVITSPERVLEEARLFVELLGTKNGRTRWRKDKVVAVRAIGDASDRAYGAFLPGG